MRISDWSSDVCSSDLLLEIILNHFDHFNDTPQAQVAAVRIQLCTNVIFGAITGTGRALDRIFHRFDNDGLVDLLFRRDAIRDSEQFGPICGNGGSRSEEHTSELQSLMRISYAVFCLKKKKIINTIRNITYTYFHQTKPSHCNSQYTLKKLH